MPGGTSGGGRVSSEEYEAAVRATGLDRSTLHTYAHVARRVDPTIRRETLSWEHHKVVAKLPPEEQQRWLDAAEENGSDGRSVSTRRLRLSIQSGRLIGEDEMRLPPSERAIDNHSPAAMQSRVSIATTGGSARSSSGKASISVSASQYRPSR